MSKKEQLRLIYENRLREARAELTKAVRFLEVANRRVDATRGAFQDHLSLSILTPKADGSTYLTPRSQEQWEVQNQLLLETYNSAKEQLNQAQARLINANLAISDTITRINANCK